MIANQAVGCLHSAGLEMPTSITPPPKGLTHHLFTKPPGSLSSFKKGSDTVWHLCMSSTPWRSTAWRQALGRLAWSSTSFLLFQERLYGGKLNRTAGPALGRGDGLRPQPPPRRTQEETPSQCEMFLCSWHDLASTVTLGLTHSPTQWASREKLYLPITYKQIINIKTQ